MCRGLIIEMATGEGKTLTAALAGSIWGWSGRPVHVITVNDYLVARDAEEMSPVYDILGLKVGHVVHDTTPVDRFDHYRRNIVYVTSKELVADFLRDQIQLGNLRSSTQTAVGMLIGRAGCRRLLMPGLQGDRRRGRQPPRRRRRHAADYFQQPRYEGKHSLYQAADRLADQLELKSDFTIDWAVRQADADRARLRIGSTRSRSWTPAASGRANVAARSWSRSALTGAYCFIRDEQYLVTSEGKVQIIDEFTGRVMADRSWRHGLHQAIEVKEGVPCHRRQGKPGTTEFPAVFPAISDHGGDDGHGLGSRAGSCGRFISAPSSASRPTSRAFACILPLRMFDTMDAKWAAVVERVCQINDTGARFWSARAACWPARKSAAAWPTLHRPHKVSTPRKPPRRRRSSPRPARRGRSPSPPTWPAAAPTSSFPAASRNWGDCMSSAPSRTVPARVDRQLFGRAARQGDPGCAQMFASPDDDLFVRHAARIRRFWR